MKKVSIILALLILLTLISGCSEKTASDIATDTETESETVEVRETEETKEIKETDKVKKEEGTKKKKNETKTEEDTNDTPESTETVASPEIVEIEPPVTLDPPAENDNTNQSSGGGNTAPSAETTKQSDPPKPAETTKQPDPPKPAEDPKPQSDSKLPATVEIFPYKGGNVAVVNVKNEKGKNCSVEVQGTYKGSDGSTIRTETKRFSGLSAGDDNYFIFNPGIAFSDFSCVTKEIEDGAPAYSNLFSFASSGTANIMANEIGGIDHIPEAYLNSLNKPTVNIELDAPGTLYFKATILLFDNSGNPVHVDEYIGNPGKGHIDRGIPVQCEKSGNKFVLPDNLKGNLRVIVALVEISETAFN